MKTGIELIAIERKRQVEEEGWTPQHDDQHTNYEMMYAAVCYILSSSSLALDNFWPKGWGDKWFKPATRQRDLVKAGALIAAEIDRLQRAKESQ